MRHIILAFIILVSVFTVSFAEEAAKNEQGIFYNANSLYEKREYDKAAEDYQKLLDTGVESGPLYYNLGNTYFKMGKIGYAILAYKKAQKIMPGDSDLKSNLSYAQSLTEDSGLQQLPLNRLTWLIKIPFREFNLNVVSVILMCLYITLITLVILGIVYPIFKHRSALFFYLILILFLITLADFGLRYYDEEIIKHGIVVVKDAECKYEPIDKSTAYFTLKEGQDVRILLTRNGWRRIRRIDGKLGWVQKDAVEEID